MLTPLTISKIYICVDQVIMHFERNGGKLNWHQGRSMLLVHACGGTSMGESMVRPCQLIISCHLHHVGRA